MSKGVSGAVSNRAWLTSHWACLIFTWPVTFEWINITQNHNECLHQQPLEKRALENHHPACHHPWLLGSKYIYHCQKSTSGPVTVNTDCSLSSIKLCCYISCYLNSEVRELSLSWTQMLPPVWTGEHKGKTFAYVYTFIRLCKCFTSFFYRYCMFMCVRTDTGVKWRFCVCVWVCVTNGLGPLVETEGLLWVKRMTEKKEERRRRGTDTPAPPANAIIWLWISD